MQSSQSGQSANTSQNNASRVKEILLILRKYRLHKGFTPQKLCGILEDLGPTFVKIGQILSMRQDMLPKEYCDQLTKLCSNVRPLPFETVCDVLQTEYGRPYSEVFHSIDPQPLGSASIAQVHAAVLTDGTPVVIKVQRPNIYHTMEQDITLLKRAISVVNMFRSVSGVVDLRAVLDELWSTAQEELDFLKEAAHMERFAHNNAGVAYVICPKVYRACTTAHVLVMQRMHGVPVDQTDQLCAQGYDMHEIGQKLAENFVKQILDDAFFHADPHPGNIWINDGKITWLDFGMMGILSGRDRELFRSAVTAIVHQDIYSLKNVFLMLGTAKKPVDHAQLYADVDEMVARYGGMELGSMNLGMALQEFMHLANKHSIRLPQSVTMLSRGIMTIEGVLCLCAPDISLLQILATHLSNTFFQSLDWRKELQRAGRGAYTALHKAAVLPSQLSDLLQTATKGQVKLHLETAPAPTAHRHTESLFNRAVLAVLIAALLITSALLTQADLTPKLGSVPLPAVLGFAAAGVLSVLLLFFTLRKKKP